MTGTPGNGTPFRKTHPALSGQWSYFFPSCGGKVVYCFIEIPYAAAMTTKPPARAGLDTARAGPEMTSQ